MADLENTNNILRYIRCTVGSEIYALDMTSVYSIQRSDNLQLEMAANNTQVGWFNIRDASVPVYSLANCLGYTRQTNLTGQRIVLMNALPGTTEMWALAVDQVSQVYITTAQALRQLPAVLCAGLERYFRAVLCAGDDLILMLEPAGIHPDRPLMAPAIFQPTRDRELSDVISAGGAAVGGRRGQQQQLIEFALPEVKDDYKFALSITQVLEILAPLPVIPVPGAAPFILGLINWRNRPIPLVDLTRRFVMTSVGDPAAHRLMIVRDASKKQEQIFGFFVHPSIHMLRLPVVYKTGAVPVAIPKAFVKGVVEIDGKLTVIPEISRILKN